MALIVDCPEDIDYEGEEIYVDVDMWEKIVLNLISNALKFTWEGSITVQLGRVEGGIELNVIDTGVGIPEEHLSNIFQRFYRVLNNNARSHEGTGIGLALIKEIVKQHGGTISVTSKAGEGSTFSVFIPEGFGHLPKQMLTKAGTRAASMRRAMVSDTVLQCTNETLNWMGNTSERGGISEEEARERQLAESPDISSLESPPPPQSPRDIPPKGSPQDRRVTFIRKKSIDSILPKPRIILVDDNQDMRKYLTFLLQPHYNVDPAPNGSIALHKARESPPDLVLSDVMMPVMDGMTLLKELRADPRTSSVPIILLTAKASSSLEGLDAGADDFLVKPFSAKELIARVSSTVKLSQLRKEITRREKEDALQQQLIHGIIEKIQCGAFSLQSLNSLVEEICHIVDADCVRACRFKVMHISSSPHKDDHKEQPNDTCLVIAECLRENLDNLNALLGETLPLNPPESFKQQTEKHHITTSVCTTSPPHSPSSTDYFQWLPLNQLEGLNSDIMTAPIFVHDSIWGVLWCIRERCPTERSTQPWQEVKRAVLNQIAAQVGLGIKQAQLAAEQREQQIMLEAAHAANHAKNMIMANISHELRTPLNAVIGLTEVLIDTPLRPEQSEVLHIVRHSG